MNFVLYLHKSHIKVQNSIILRNSDIQIILIEIARKNHDSKNEKTSHN